MTRPIFTTRDGRSVEILKENTQEAGGKNIRLGYITSPYGGVNSIAYYQPDGQVWWVDGYKHPRTLTYGLEIPGGFESAKSPCPTCGGVAYDD